MEVNSIKTNLPIIEWPEDQDPETVTSTLSSITKLLHKLAEQAVGQVKLLYIVNPEPSRNIEHLVETLSDLSASPRQHYQSVSFGNKGRSWAACFFDCRTFERALPAFFIHSPECLNILVIEDPINKFNSGFISSLCDQIILKLFNQIRPPNYVGLSFETDSLVEIFTNVESIEAPVTM